MQVLAVRMFGGNRGRGWGNGPPPPPRGFRGGRFQRPPMRGRGGSWGGPPWPSAPGRGHRGFRGGPRPGGWNEAGPEWGDQGPNWNNQGRDRTGWNNPGSNFNEQFSSGRPDWNGQGRRSNQVDSQRPDWNEQGRRSNQADDQGQRPDWNGRRRDQQECPPDQSWNDRAPILNHDNKLHSSGQDQPSNLKSGDQTTKAEASKATTKDDMAFIKCAPCGLDIYGVEVIFIPIRCFFILVELLVCEFHLRFLFNQVVSCRGIFSTVQPV